MPQFMSKPTRSREHVQQRGKRPAAWLLAAPGAGDNRQLEALAGLIGAEARWVGCEDSIGRVLFDRLAGFRASGIAKAKREAFAPPWPDLVLIAGGRSVIDARRIRNASGGKSRVVCVGRPWAPLDWFDLVVTTPQYRLPAAANVLELELPLNLPQSPPDAELADWESAFADLRRPLLGVLLGGDSGSYRFTHDCADRLARRVDEVAALADAAVVVVASPRTPVAAVERIENALAAPGSVCRWSREGANPYRSLLELADAFVVTGDSASMIAEAVHTGKPVALFDLHERLRSRVNRKLTRVTGSLGGLRQALTRRGMWFPARDMPALHRKVGKTGEIVVFEELFATDPRKSGAELEQTREKIITRIETLLKDPA